MSQKIYRAYEFIGGGSQLSGITQSQVSGLTTDYIKNDNGQLTQAQDATIWINGDIYAANVIADGMVEGTKVKATEGFDLNLVPNDSVSNKGLRFIDNGTPETGPGFINIQQMNTTGGLDFWHFDGGFSGQMHRNLSLTSEGSGLFRGDIDANNFIGNGSQLTGITESQIINLSTDLININNSITGETANRITSDTALQTQVTELTLARTEQKDSGFIKWNVISGDCYSVSGSTFNLLKSGYGRINGTRVDFLPQSISFPGTYGVVFAKINSNGTLITGGSVDYDNEFPLFYLFVGVSGTYYVALEAHNYSFDIEPSTYLHKTIGVVIAGTGGNVAIGGTTGHVAISGNAELLDHGLTANISNTAGVGVTWIQDYKNSSGQWALNSLNQALQPSYNNANTVTALSAGKFGVYRLYATKQSGNDDNARYVAIMDSHQYNNQGAAQTAINQGTVDIADGALIQVEIAQLGFAIVNSSGVIVSTTVAKQTLSLQSVGASLQTAAGTSFIPTGNIAATNVQDAIDELDTEKLAKLRSINFVTATTYTLLGVDNLIYLTNAATISLTIPTNAVTPLAVGTQIDLVQGGAGKITVGGAGITINSKGGLKSSNGKYVGLTLIKTATDTWLLVGDLQA